MKVHGPCFVYEWEDKDGPLSCAAVGRVAHSIRRLVFRSLDSCDGQNQPMLLLTWPQMRDLQMDAHSTQYVNFQLGRITEMHGLKIKVSG